MKCWDSITSAMAASTSALMVACWALRSSSGTCILYILSFHLFVGLGALAQVRRQRRFFIQIEAPYNPGLNFLITIPALGANHYPFGDGLLKTGPTATHPPDLTLRVTDNSREFSYLLHIHAT